MAKKSKKPARKAAKAPARSQSRPNSAAFYAAKLEAEWGPIDLKHALDERPGEIVVLDTRSPDAFRTEHLPQAINIPTEQLEQRLSELPKNKEIVPYCWSIVCHLATRAALTLAQKGFRVHELAGGIGTWKEYKLPVSGAVREPALS
jgi:rhodanese-related sulfurtransferase